MLGSDNILIPILVFNTLLLVGMTHYETLYYIPSTCILTCTSLRFDINLHTYSEPVKFLVSLPGRSFCVDIDNSALGYYFGSPLFFFIQST